MRKFLASLAFAVLVMGGQSVWAVPISGTISFGGDGMPSSGATWYQSTGVGFINPWLVTQRSGDYAGIALGTNAIFTDVEWGAGSGMVNVPLAQNIWTFTIGAITYALDVGNVDNIDRGTAANDNISVTGTGILTITGFDPTPATWSYTAGFTSGGVQNLSFSAGTSQVSPEPASLLLLGLGLIAGGRTFARRFRR